MSWSTLSRCRYVMVKTVTSWLSDVVAFIRLLPATALGVAASWPRAGDLAAGQYAAIYPVVDISDGDVRGDRPGIRPATAQLVGYRHGACTGQHGNCRAGFSRDRRGVGSREAVQRSMFE